MSKSPITCHVLDASVGRPASSVRVVLQRLTGVGEHSSDGSSTFDVAEGITNEDGRCLDLLEGDAQLPAGIYKMRFLTGSHFESQAVETFYPLVEVIFKYGGPSQHYHIPLLISPFSYTTYRGS